MRFLTWNINHRAHGKPIPEKMAEAIASLSPDVVVLTEYVPGPSHEIFMADLASFGFPHTCMSDYNKEEKPRQNHILVASNTPLNKGMIKALKITDSVVSNFLHVHLPQKACDVIGLRVPDFSKQQSIRRAYWDWLVYTTDRIKNEPFVILGDFNVDPAKSPSHFRESLKRIIVGGWQHYDSPSSASWWPRKGKGGDGNRLDHCILTRHFTCRNAEYKTESGSYIFAKEPGAMSDHAVLIVDADL